MRRSEGQAASACYGFGGGGRGCGRGHRSRSGSGFHDHRSRCRSRGCYRLRCSHRSGSEGQASTACHRLGLWGGRCRSGHRSRCRSRSGHRSRGRGRSCYRLGRGSRGRRYRSGSRGRCRRESGRCERQATTTCHRLRYHSGCGGLDDCGLLCCRCRDTRLGRLLRLRQGLRGSERQTRGTRGLTRRGGQGLGDAVGRCRAMTIGRGAARVQLARGQGSIPYAVNAHAGCGGICYAGYSAGDQERKYDVTHG